MRESLHERPSSDVRFLYQVAMLVFVVTVSIGILNGLKVLTFERPQLLTHVHAGTIGWITLGAFATTFWIFGSAGGGAARWLGVLAAVAVPFYVAAFWSGNLPARAITGVPVLAAIVGVFVWVVARTRAAPLTVPRLAVLLALFTLVLGSIIGVLVQVSLATGTKLVPDSAIGGHVGAQVVGYLVLIAMAISEWMLVPDTGRPPKLGIAQIVLPFVGGLLVMLGAMFDVQPLLGAFIPFEVVALAIYVWRIGPRLARVQWLRADPARQFGLMVPFLVADVALLIRLITGVVSGEWPDFAQIPPWLVFGFDHAMFIGVMSNGLFGLVQETTRPRQAVLGWADHVLFWGMNAGMIGFVASLVANARDLERLFTPVMGGSILAAILAYTLRLRARPAPREACAPA